MHKFVGVDPGLADISALRDYFSRAEAVNSAAARALACWDSGDLAEAMRGLQAALEAAVPTTIEDYVRAQA